MPPVLPMGESGQAPLLLHALCEAFGAAEVLTDQAIDERYKTDWSKATRAEPLAVLRPRDTADLSRALAICHQHGQPVTVQGGMTGLVGGSQVNAGEIVISLERLQGIEEIDPAASTMILWAGTPLQVAQQAAEQAGLYVAVDLGARGSCQIGGNISTNAGGNRVIRYGMMREQILGLEVVMADGTVINSLNKMLKNNAGYDLKQWFIGSEGTLGVITRAVLRLHPMPTESTAVLCALPDDQSVLTFLARAQQAAQASLLAFEVMWPAFYDFMTSRVPGNPKPIDVPGALTVLMECTTGAGGLSTQGLESLLEEAMESGEIVDAAIAQSGKESEAFWRIRDSVSEFPLLWSPYTSFDVSLPIQRIGEFVTTLQQRLVEQLPNAESLYFGHIGDSNLHIAVHVPGPRETFPKAEIEREVYELVRQFEGSVSAEHGIGTRKKQWLGYSRKEEEIQLMRTIKQALDPKNILNRGKVI